MQNAEHILYLLNKQNHDGIIKTIWKYAVVQLHNHKYELSQIWKRN